MIEGRQVFVLLIVTVASAAGVPLKNIVIKYGPSSRNWERPQFKRENPVYDLQ
jgi:hypothetical protein